MVHVLNVYVARRSHTWCCMEAEGLGFITPLQADFVGVVVWMCASVAIEARSRSPTVDGGYFIGSC